MSPLALLDCRFMRVQDRRSETRVSVHLCEAYLMNTGVFGRRESDQTLVVDGAAARPTSCLHLVFEWEQGDFKPRIL